METGTIDAQAREIFISYRSGALSAEDLFTQIDNLARPILWRFILARNYRLSSADIDDAAQECMIRMADVILKGELNLAEQPLMRWLFLVARRLLIDQWRSARNRHEVSMEQPSSSADLTDRLDPSLTDWLMHRRVRAALGRLPWRQRFALIMHYHQGMTYAELAHLLGETETAVTKRVWMARQALRRDPELGVIMKKEQQ